MRVTGFAIWVYFFLIVSTLSYGQKQVNTGNQQWFQYYNTLQIANQWAIQTDMGIRYREQMSDLSQMVFRSGLEYQWNSNIKTTAGFAFLTFHQDGVRSRVEYRPYQELDITHTYGSVKTQHRFRLEERFFSSKDEFGTQSNFNLRYRYRFMTSIPIITFKNEKKLLINIGDEILINSGKEIIYNIFDSNRLLIGPALQINPNLNVSIFYNHMFAQQNQADAFSQTYILWFAVKHKISLN